MNILDLVWKPNQQSKGSLYDVNVTSSELVIKLKMEGELVEIEDKVFLIEERSSNRQMQFGLHFRNNTYEVKIPLNAPIWQQYSGGTLDAYIQYTDKDGLGQKKRVSDNLTNTSDIDPVFIKAINKSLILYSTIKGNLSFKILPRNAFLKTDMLTLSEEGELYIQGQIQVPYWNVSDPRLIKKELIVKTRNQRHSLPLTKQVGKWNEFHVNLHLKDPFFNPLLKSTAQLQLKIGYDNEEVILPITIPGQLAFNNMAEFQTNEGIKRIYLNVEEDGVLSLLAKIENLQAEINCVYSENGTIELNGKLIDKNELENKITNRASLIFRLRDSSIEHEEPIQLEDSYFSYLIPIADFIEKGLFIHGIWDLYLKFNHQEIRLVTRMDDIRNKQQLVSIPQQLMYYPDGTAFVIKPYYTLHEEVSILCRDQIMVKTIDKVESKNTKLEITGKLNIQPPNDSLPEITGGKITLKGEFGKIYTMPVTWHLRKTGKTPLEFQFKAVVDLKEEGLENSVGDLLRQINFDLIDCELQLEHGNSPFTMFIDPVKVIASFEDTFKHRPRIQKRIQRGRLLFYKMLNKLAPMSKKMVIFQSFHGKSYSCSPRAIYEQMLEENRPYKYIWVLNNLNDIIPGKAKIVRPHSFKYYYYMARAKYFISNGNFPDFLEKRKKAIHLQTWHGTPLKKLGFDIDPDSPSYAENTSPALMKRNARWDYLIGPNKYTSDILKRAFKFDKQMLDVGYPRNDLFYKQERADKALTIKQKLNIPADKKVILYAPTWRDYDFHSGNQHKPYEFKFSLDKFIEEFGDEYVLLLRLHYRDAARIKLKGLDNFVYNVSSYNDIQELYLISDILMTDYSSVMFDYANLDRPMIFFAYDINRYGSQIRGFYMNFQKEAPGPIVRTERELFDTLKNMDIIAPAFKEKYEKFKEEFCHWEKGQSSKEVIQAVFGHSNK